jgi:predicted amidohydrolase
MSARREGPRPAVIGTCSLSGRNIKDPEVLLANGLAMIDKMAQQAEKNGWGLDLVTLPETFGHPDGSKSDESAQTLDGPIVSAVARKARAYSTYAVVPLRLREQGQLFNSAVLLDRRGEPVGVYHKVFPVVLPDETLEGGITPGCEFPIFNLDFGRVGIQICFDVAYEDGWKALAVQEVELVAFPSAAPCVSALVSHAYRFGYYIVGAIYRPPAIIVNPLGREIARAPQDRDVALVRVDLDYRILPSRFTWTRGPEIKRKYGDRLDFGWHDPEGACVMTSLDPELPVGRLVESEGLETYKEFIERNFRAQMKARGGPPAMPR